MYVNPYVPTAKIWKLCEKYTTNNMNIRILNQQPKIIMFV